MGRNEGLHQRDLLFYTSFTDIAVFIMMQPSFIMQQRDIGFTDDPFGVLFIPFFSRRKKQVKVEWIYLFCILEMRFKTFDEVVPEQKFIFVIEPRKTYMRKGTKSRKKTASFSLHFKINEVSKL